MTNTTKIKDGKLVDCTISEAVRYQVPREIRSEYPEFIFFLEEYYRWLELEGNAHFASICLPNSLDIDRTVDAYLEFFRDTYLYNIPVDFFGVDRCESVQYTVNEDFESGLTYQCLCEGESIRFFIDPSDTVTIGQFPIDFLRAANWMMSIKVETTSETESLHIITTHNGVDTFSQTYANVGGSPNYDLNTLIDTGIFKLNITNNEAVRLVVDIIRAPSFTDSPELGVQRTFLFDKLINDLTDVKVTLNGTLLDNSLYTVSDPIGFCGEELREITIDESVTLANGDVLVIEACEQREVNQRLLMKTIQDLLKSKGTDESFKFLFRLLFNEEIEIVKPGENILKTSDGKWESDRRSIRISTNGNIDNFLFRRANVVKSVQGEDIIVGSFLIENAEEIIISNYSVADLFVSNVQGSIETSNTLVLRDGKYIPEYRVIIEYTSIEGIPVSESEMIYPTITDLKIIDGGTNYTVGNKINVVDGFNFKRRFTSDGVTTLINTGISGTLLSGETQVILDPDGAATLLTENIDYTLTNSSVQLLASIPVNTVVEIRLFSKGNVITVTQSDGVGAIKDITVFNGGVGYDGNVVDLTGLGGGDATLELDEDVIIRSYRGRYLNNDGHLSSTPVLQDGYKNQAFSYVIRSSRSIDQYGAILKRLLHPAGFAYFGEILLIDCINSLIRDAYYIYDISDVISQSQSTSDAFAPRLGPRYRSFDENKLRYKIWDGLEPNTPVQTIYDELVGYFITTPDDKLRFLVDSYIEITAILVFPFVSNSAQIALNYEINEGDTIIVEGNLSGIIADDVTPLDFIDYDNNIIGFEANTNGEEITVTIIINTTV